MDDARALQGLADAIHTSIPEEQVRMTRLVIERKSEVILRAIVELLDSPDIQVKRIAAWALGVSPYPPAVPSLKELLDDEDEEVRDYARIADCELIITSFLGRDRHPQVKVTREYNLKLDS